jgi:muramoyltetrapeptide carboxypeptidase
MATPKYKIFVISPSGKADKIKVMQNAQYLENSGHELQFGEFTFDSFGPFASTDENRLKDLQNAFNSNTDIIWMTRGGYGLTKIIDQLNLDQFIKHPKIVIGYSDITALFLDNRMEEYSMCHASMLQSSNPQNIDYTLNLIKSRSQVFQDIKTNSEFKIKTEICGGNLSLIIDHVGITKLDFYNDKFLLLEEISEHDYKIDRMLNHLNRSGIFDRITGILLGSFEDILEGNTAIQNFHHKMISEFLELEMPICYNLPIGHIENNHGILLNTPVEMECDGGNLILNYK